MINRPIKYKVWDGKKMHKVCRLGVEGFSHHLWSPSPETCDSVFFDSVKIIEFTGLLDRSGEEVFESDIFKNDWRNKPYRIFFYDGAFRGIYDVEPNPDFRGWIFDGYEASGGIVIGNYLENPELLVQGGK